MMRGLDRTSLFGTASRSRIRGPPANRPTQTNHHLRLCRRSCTSGHGMRWMAEVLAGGYLWPVSSNVMLSVLPEWVSLDH